ncbi:hypothetical protein [Bosea sp. Root381]|uniref:hypothetical protein n=1 Tax=Bosea sp. Root381 TaxID=1736524 RepID=UPI0012E34E7E|nr:hypothetical protein [Bosea sp. Root381]
MDRASSWNEATPDSEFARILPRRPFERWIVAGLWLLIAALLAGRLVLPAPSGEAPPSAAQVTIR